MISFDEALDLTLQAANPAGRETVLLAKAAGRVLAEPVRAVIDSPRADCSAMDGYAVREVDLPGTLAIVGESFPGRGFSGALPAGSCVRIFTGGPVPSGADRIVIQEEVIRSGNCVTFDSGAQGPHYIRPRGSDFRAGDVLLEAGQTLTPRAMVAAAAADVAQITAWHRPRVALLATGDELVVPGSARDSEYAVPESISLGISALAHEWGAEIILIKRLRDDLVEMEDTAKEALAHADLVVVTGGASVGEKDFAKAMFAPHGFDPIYTKVAIKPGKPVWLGRASGRLVMGLPGNPTSALVTARLLLAPLIARMSGRSGRHDWRKVALAGPLPPCGDRETFVRARLTEAGALPLENQDSGAQHALAQADLLLRCPAHSAARTAGEAILSLTF